MATRFLLIDNTVNPAVLVLDTESDVTMHETVMRYMTNTGAESLMLIEASVVHTLKRDKVFASRETGNDRRETGEEGDRRETGKRHKS